MSAPKPLVAPVIPHDMFVSPVLKIKPFPTDDEGPKYIFRYVSLPTFMVMFYMKRFIFKSAVSYKDQHECTYPYNIANHVLMNSNTNRGGQAFDWYHDTLTLERGRYFSSCWFGSDDTYPRETMRQYFSRDGVVVLFDRKKLLKAFKSDITMHSKDMSDLQLSAYGSVEYYSADEFVKNVLDDQAVTHPAFAKSKNFELESEYRFVVDIGERLLEFDYLNKQPPHKGGHLKEFNRNNLSISAHLPENKSFNDIGLLKVIGCSEQADLALLFLSRQREVEFWKLQRQNEKYIFRQKDGDEIKTASWEYAVKHSHLI